MYYRRPTKQNVVYIQLCSPLEEADKVSADIVLLGGGDGGDISFLLAGGGVFSANGYIWEIKWYY